MHDRAGAEALGVLQRLRRSALCRIAARRIDRPPERTLMIIDFQHHFTPRELIKEDPGNRLILHYDAQGAPSYTIHALLYDLDEHVRMMDLAGIDAAWLTSAAGMCADLETSRLVNKQTSPAEPDYSGRFIGAAHSHPLGGDAAFKELARCRYELGFQGVVITSEFDGKFIDDPALELFWSEA